MMKVTHFMIADTVLRDMNRNLEELNRVGNQLASGKKINKPSDDPAGIAKVMRLSKALDMASQYIKNVEDAISWMDVTESAMAQINEIVHRARDLVIQSMNDTLDQTDRRAIAAEINQLIHELGQAINAAYAERFVNAGYGTPMSPVVLYTTASLGFADYVYAYSIRADLGRMYYEIDFAGYIRPQEASFVPSRTTGAMWPNLVRVNFVAQELLSVVATGETFGAGYTASVSDYLFELGLAQSGVSRLDLISTLMLARDALVHYDRIGERLLSVSGQDVMYNVLQRIDRALQILTTRRSELGARYRRLEIHRERLYQLKEVWMSLIGKEQGLDIPEAIMRLRMYETSYRAALLAGSRLMLPSLMDFIR